MALRAIRLCWIETNLSVFSFCRLSVFQENAFEGNPAHLTSPHFSNFVIALSHACLRAKSADSFEETSKYDYDILLEFILVLHISIRPSLDAAFF